MACELLLHKDAHNANRSSFLLIEEPEAHIHAQRQLKLVQSLEDARLKCQYVAMTRATALLCMAIPIEYVDVECQKLLIKNGWEIKVIQ